MRRIGWARGLCALLVTAVAGAAMALHRLPGAVQMAPATALCLLLLALAVFILPRRPVPATQAQAVLDAVSCAIILVNRRGHIELANATAHRMFGYQTGDLRGAAIEQLVPLARRQSHLARRAEYLTQPTQRAMGSGLDLHGQRRDGSLFPVEIDLSPLPGPGHPMVLATVLDATQMRRIAEQDSRIAAIVNASDDAIVGKDMDGVITSWNPAAERIFGYTADEAIGRKIVVLFPPERAGDETEILRRVARGETISHLPVTRVRKDGSPVEISASIAPIRASSGAIIGAAKVARDVTELRVAEAATSRERAKLQTLLETANDAVHVLDANGRVAFCSDSFLRMLGYSKNEAASLCVDDWDVTSHENESFAEAMVRLTREPGIFESQYRLRSGEVIDVEVSARGVVLEGARYLFCSARDISGRKRQEAERQRQLQELERVNRDLDDFVYVASHDLRSPLRAVSSLAQWINDDDPSLDAATRARLQLIQLRVRRMSTLLDDIMAYARVGRDAVDSAARQNAAALVVEVAETLGIGARFELRLDPDLHGIAVAVMPLKQVFHNLIDNAAKHHDRERGVIAVSVRDGGAYHRFTVTDDGPGIPGEYRAAVFEMFKTLRPRDAVEGSGMGLALVRKIVQQRGGACGIGSGTGRGLLVWFDWPKMAIAGEAAS